MGTMLAASGVPAGGCNEEINLSSPETIAKIHHAYLAAGADIITANTFGASRISLADHDLKDKVFEFNKAAIAIARKEAEKFSTPDKSRFVAGELGPTSKLPTLGHIGFDELFGAYVEQALVLIDSGADIIAIVTCQDPLQAKAAAAAVRESFKKTGRALPLFISVTVEKSGTMLLGTDIAAMLTAIAPYKPFAFGMNCATGPDAMKEHLAVLSHKSPFPISCRPNAGIPENVGGKAVYTLSPDEFAKILAGCVDEYKLSFVGGCCGTTPEHIEALYKRLKQEAGGRRQEARRHVGNFATVSSLYASIELDQEPRPFIVAEQTNVNGSKKFRELLLESNFEAMADVARKTSKASHALDICVAYAGRDECADMAEIVRRVSVKSQAAIMIDSTNPDVIEAALKLIPGRPIINSINLEDGGRKVAKILKIARRFGAAVVALTIDEKGMAKSTGEKFAVAKRLVDLCVSEGLSRDDVLIDALTFTLASGDSSLKNAGIETLDAIRRIKRELSSVRTILGVSNISFGLPPAGRRILTSVFLHEALLAGLDAAIINTKRIVPYHMISEEERLLCARLIKNDGGVLDPLKALIEHYSKDRRKTELEMSISSIAKTPEEELKIRVLEGRASGIEIPIGALLKSMAPSQIINEVLLPAMQEVGKLFGEGDMPLPFVLESAETMRAAIDIIAPHMDASAAVAKGTIVLATVRGDVHDIGKNLVDAILSNNGFKVINLGIRQPARAIIDAVKAHSADAIGLSGLLVSSTEIMKEDLEVFREEGLSIPVLCGGAALTKSFTDNALATTYGSKVYYCADAFAGLVAMEEITRKGSGAGK